MRYEIRDIYKYNIEENTLMLSDFASSVDPENDFWKPYRDNHAYFDRIFKKKYTSWFPFDQEGDLEDVSEEFALDVKGWLMINDKRYSELYRIQTIADDEKYSLTDNVYEVESIEETGEHSSEFNKGAQIDTEDLESVKGQQIDTQDNERVKGSQTDTQDNERVKGQEQIDTDATNTTGATGKTITNSVSAFNESGFSSADKSEEDDESRQDTIDQTVIEGQRTDTEDLSTTYGQRTDTEDLSTTYGQRTDTQDNSRTSGARKDTDEGSDSKTIERTRSGNIGVKTVAQMLEEQWNVWGIMNLYDLIFSEITRELLRGC